MKTLTRDRFAAPVYMIQVTKECKERKRKERKREIKRIMDVVREHVDIHAFALLGSVIALVDFGEPGVISVHLYRQVTTGTVGARYEANTKTMFANKQLWAIPKLSRKAGGRYVLGHTATKGVGLCYYTTHLLKSVTIK